MPLSVFSASSMILLAQELHFSAYLNVDIAIGCGIVNAGRNRCARAAACFVLRHLCSRQTPLRSSQHRALEPGDLRTRLSRQLAHVALPKTADLEISSMNASSSAYYKYEARVHKLIRYLPWKTIGQIGMWFLARHLWEIFYVT
jgi:hypothetical protein